MYDLCFRATQGLPLPARKLTTFFLESILAKLTETKSIIVCNFVWMSNHPHIQVVSQDINAMKDFYGGLKKRITDLLKRFLALPYLSLWDDRTNVGEVLDLDAAIERIVYAFLNPVRAKLVRSVDEYSGLNTWKEFIRAAPCTNAVVTKVVPHILATDIEPLSQVNPSFSEEHRVIERLMDAAKSRPTHTLRLYPLKWLEAFGITDPQEVEKIQKRIITRVREGEKEIARTFKKAPLRRIEGYIVTDSYLPPKRQRKIFMFGSTKELRTEFLSLYRHFADRCKQCYELLKEGLRSVDWPPECFIPPPPRICNPV